jgi:hypothetical protein
LLPNYLNKRTLPWRQASKNRRTKNQGSSKEDKIIMGAIDKVYDVFFISILQVLIYLVLVFYCLEFSYNGFTAEYRY